MVESVSIQSPSVVVSDNALLIADLLETDPEVVRLVASADDPVAATRRCLQVGARAVRAASAALDHETVQVQFDRLSLDFGRCVDGAIDQISSIASDLLDDEGGGLKTVLDRHQHELDQVLDARFDPDSKKSVMGEIEKIVEESLVRQSQAIKRVVSLDAPDSPLQVLKTEILAGFTRPIAELGQQVRELSEKVAVNEAVAPVIEMTTAKGFAFEEVLHRQLSAMAAVHGDLAEMTGSEFGVAGNKKGDEVVTINSEDTSGLVRRVVFEAKARKLNVRLTHQELDAALENRDAVAAVAVFDDQAKAPTSVPFAYSENKAIAVLDDDGDPSALRLAYMWARWLVRRTDAGGPNETDPARVSALFDAAQRALERHTTIKRAHTQVRNGIDQAASQVELMVSELDAALNELHAELSANETEEN